MKIGAKEVKTLGGLILNGGVNILIASATGGLIPGNSVTGELIKAITGNIVSNHVATLSNTGFDHLVSRLKENNPNKVNHDLERLFRTSSVVALEYIKQLFLQDLDKIEGYTKLSKREKKDFAGALTFFFNENIADLRMIVGSEEREPMDKRLIKDPVDFLDNITNQIFRITSVTFDSETEALLKSFYTEKLPYCFELAFKEALKHDDLGFKAFQIWTLEEMQKQNADLLSVQQKIAGALETLSNNGSFLNKQEEERKWEKITDTIYDRLEKEFSGIKQQLVDLTIIISETFGEIVCVIKDVYVAVVEISDDVKELRTDTREIRGITKDIKAQIKSLKHMSKVIKHDLGVIPFRPQYFIGRENELEAIREKFLAGINIIPLSADGGLGKSSLAGTYYHMYCNEYAHAVWVLNKGNIAESLLSLAESLHLSFGEAMPLERQLDVLVREMASLPKPCLLVIDNANDRNDVSCNSQLLRRLHNFHILVTTRLKTFVDIDVYKIGRLSEELGLQLFKKYYAKHSLLEDELFRKLYNAIGGNTLVIELLAKKLYTLNRFKVVYKLEDLLMELREKGVLSQNRTTKVDNVDYHAHDGIMRTEAPEIIIEAMYELSDLNDVQVAVLSVFALLPAESIPYDASRLLLFDIESPDSHLDLLCQGGWLDFDDMSASFKINPLIQEIVRKKNKKIFQSCTPFISSLIKELKKIRKNDSAIYLRYGVSVVETLSNLPDCSLDSLDSNEKEVMALLCYLISEIYDAAENSLMVDRFLSIGINHLENILTNDFLHHLKEKNQKGTLSEKELELVMQYVTLLESAALTKSALGYLRESGQLFNKARSLADRDPQKGFNLPFNYYAYNKYLVKSGRLMEAESYFFDVYKRSKHLFAILSDSQSFDDLLGAYEESSGLFYDFLNIRSKEDMASFFNWDKSGMNVVKENFDRAKETVLSWRAASALDLAKIFRIQGRFEEAIYFHKKFIMLLEGRGRKDADLDLAIGWHSMAIALLMEGKKLDEAESLLNAAFDVYKNYCTEGHLFFGQCYMNLFQVKVKRDAEIDIELYSKANKIISQNLGEDSADIIEMNTDIYQQLISIQNNEEAVQQLKTVFEEALVRSCFENIKSTIDRFGMYHPVLHKALELTALILDERDRCDAAEGLRRKKRELARVLNKRTYIRTYDFASRRLSDLNDKLKLVKKIKPYTSLPLDVSEFELDVIELPFYKSYNLCRVVFVNTLVEAYKYVLISEDDVIPIETTNKPIYDLGERDLQLTDDSVKYYVSFFFDVVYGIHGKFYVMNDYKEIPWRIDVPIDEAFKDAFKTVVMPVEVVSTDADEYILEGYCIFRDSIFKTKLKINKQDGTVYLYDEDLILIDTVQAPFTSVAFSVGDIYRDENKSCKLIDEIPACIDPIY